MKKELKICLPLYKTIYSLSFILILSIVRGVSYENEIGIAMEPAMAILAAVFCADTYLIERQGKRWEVFTLFEPGSKAKVILRRLLIQVVYLIGISIIGYGLFYTFQKPAVFGDSLPLANFAMFVIAVAGTVLFWGAASMTTSNLVRNIWVGIGGTLLIWLTQNSKAGERLWGEWNLFSFTFREIEQLNNWDWMRGKMVSLILAAFMIAIIPFILKKRG